MSSRRRPLFEFNKRFFLHTLSVGFACTLFFAVQNRVEAQGLEPQPARPSCLQFCGRQFNGSGESLCRAARRFRPRTFARSLRHPLRYLSSATSCFHREDAGSKLSHGRWVEQYSLYRFHLQYSVRAYRPGSGDFMRSISSLQILGRLPTIRANMDFHRRPILTMRPTEAEGNAYTPFLSMAAFRSQNTALIYSVWRLDAATPALAQGLVDKAIAAEATGLTGQVCIDETTNRRGTISASEVPNGNSAWPRTSRREAGFSVTEDSNDAEFGTAPAPFALRQRRSLFRLVQL